MIFRSTRDGKLKAPFSKALLEGLAPDGGLYVPDFWPEISADEFKDFEKITEYAEFSTKLLRYFISEEKIATALTEICREAFNFRIPLIQIDSTTSILELFHGPTSAFKDVGARFLAACMEQVLKDLDPSRKNTVLVATSGDTGGAVAAAFFKKKNIEVKILFPKGKISARQEKQLTAWGDNISAIAVEGSFDDCQSLVKKALLDPELKKSHHFISANSINLGRILPQMVYYAYTAIHYKFRYGYPCGFIIPSGNLGNSLAAVWAWRLGFPIREIVLATNSNMTILNYSVSGIYKPLPTEHTLANAMDVGNPSNMERYLDLLKHDEFQKLIKVFSASDQLIQKVIREGESRWGQIWCPHTATAVSCLDNLPKNHWVIVATAHPAKFESIVEPLIHHDVSIPIELLQILQKSSNVIFMNPNYNEFKSLLSELKV